MALRALPYRTLRPLIRDHLSRAEDAETAALIERFRAARRRGYLTKSELEAACRWKSPRSIGRVRQNQPRRIRTATTIALTAMSERDRIGALTELQGVSVPSASAILTLVDPVRYGVIDIRVWQLLHRLGLVEGNAAGTNLTHAHWERFLVLLRRYAAMFRVPARDVERTLFLIHQKYHEARLYRSGNRMPVRRET
jgi:hypothetical protein